MKKTKYIKQFENYTQNESLNPTQTKLQDFFKNNDFNVHLFEQDNIQCAEVEQWTDGGVDMVIVLMPFTKEKFVEYVDNFDIDDEIDNYRQDKNYKSNFTISESLNDFTNFHNHLKDIVQKLKTI